MAGELFKSMAGVDVLHVPYKGSSGARTDVLAGHVQMMFDAVTAMAPQARSGKVKALATTGRTRSSIMPEVPTVTESGVPGYEAVIWLGADGAGQDAACRAAQAQRRGGAHRGDAGRATGMGRAGRRAR